jgi:A/G-specific adenine glycosylase
MTSPAAHLGISPDDLRYFHRVILKWYRKNGRGFAWRSSDDPYRILLAEILLQRTQASQVENNYRRILSQFPTLRSIHYATEDDLRRAFEPLGLAKRVPQVKQLADRIMRAYGGRVPRTVDELRTLPGIGQYIANATVCFAFGTQTPIVDVNVIRVYERFFGIASDRQRPRDDPELWRFAGDALPRRRAAEYNRALIDFASLVCKPRTPLCSECPIHRQCQDWRTREARTKERELDEDCV